MAQRIITYVQYTDDLTGETFAEGEGETLSYVLDGTSYEVDLVAANAKAFREALAPFVSVSRKTVDTRKKPTAGPGKKRRRTRAEMERIREWAREQGYPTGENTVTPNRVPFDTVQRYVSEVEQA